MKYLFFLIFSGFYILSLYACIKKEEPTIIHCATNNMEVVNGVCNCPITKYRLNDACITPSPNMYYGIGDNHKYFDTITLSIDTNPTLGITPNAYMNASEQDYSLAGGLCEYFSKPSGDSTVYSMLSDFWVNNTKCYITFSGKYSIDKREIKMQLRWRRQSDLQPIDTTYMTLRNYIQ
jgi:hypothetical protein